MPEPFKLTKEEFNKIDQEWQWTYLCLSIFTFNERTIKKLTITDRCQENHKEAITNELILN